MDIKFLESKIHKVHRFLLCARLYGIRNALRMNLRTGRSEKLRTLLFHRNGHPSIKFTFRGKTDMGVLSHFFKPGIYIKDSPEFPIETIMDCGANIGDETTRFRIHYPNAEIIAVEADPDNFAILQENVGEDDKITPVLGAVWSIDSELKLSKAGNGNPESSFVAESDGGVRVKSFSIPSLIKLRKWRKIDILKLDVEGAESHIFKADTTWLNCVNCLVFEVPDSDVPGTLQLIFEKLRNQKWNGRTCGECLALVRQELDWNIDTVVGVKH